MALAPEVLQDVVSEPLRKPHSAFEVSAQPPTEYQNLFPIPGDCDPSSRLSPLCPGTLLPQFLLASVGHSLI